MDLTASQKRSSVWEINYRDRVSLASRLVKDMLDDEVKKQQLKINIADRPEQLKCGFCDTPVHFSEHIQLGLYFKHRAAGKDEEVRSLHSSCPFYTGDDRHPLLAQIYSGEGRWHFDTKHLIASILERDPLCKLDSVQVEKYIINHDEDTKRRPDVYFEDLQDGKWAIELTNHWMNPTIAVERAKFFRNNDINVIWLLSPKCHLNQDSMFRFTLFGLSGKPNTTSEISSHFNGYAMDDDASLISKQESKFNIKALLPTFYVNRSENKVDYNVEEVIVHFSELHKDSESNVPYLDNFFIHRLVNERDLFLLDNTISTLDNLSRNLIPNLSKGSCIATGTSFDLPIVLQVHRLDIEKQPDSEDVDLEELWQ